MDIVLVILAAPITGQTEKWTGERVQAPYLKNKKTRMVVTNESSENFACKTLYFTGNQRISEILCVNAPETAPNDWRGTITGFG